MCSVQYVTMASTMITGAPSMDVAGPPMDPGVMSIPPMDNTAEHPDHYIPEPVRHFLPYFHKQVVEKVGVSCQYSVYRLCLAFLVGSKSLLLCTLKKSEDETRFSRYE